VIRRGATFALLALAVLLLGAPPAPAASYAGSTIEADGLRMPARVAGRDVQLATANGFRTRFWPGVNLGATVPGTQPGEVAPARADYDRWLGGMGALGTRVVRVYTILRPAFYDALAAYNRRHPRAPIYLLQGVWIPEDEFIAAQDAYAPAVTDGFRAELRDAVAVLHGDASLPLRRGHAGGRYRTSVARWTLGWSIGVEWDPYAVQGTDAKHAGVAPFAGRWFSATPDATPMESWIASMLDYTAGLEAARGWSRPLTFTNWLTVDPLDHPSEPLEQEDMVSVDATHIGASGAWPGGFFASYHAYPYYPDFLRFEYPVGDPYAAYLRALRAHHGDQALMVTEFGQPSSVGLAHRGPLGRDQGAHTEAEALRIDAELLRRIKAEGYAGGVVFEWIDEWFKFTWNTIDVELPRDRRQLWRNPLTNEEHFGLIAAEPKPRGTGRAIAKGVLAGHDEEQLHLRLANAPRGEFTIGLDVRPGANKGLPGLPGAFPAADVAVMVGRGPRARLVQAAWTDVQAFQYGVARDYVDVDPADLRQGSGAWISAWQILNRPYTVPSTGERRDTETADVGDIRWAVKRRGRAVELRIPWSMLTFSDPSSHQVAVPHADGSITTQRVGRTGIAIASGGRLVRTRGYAWSDWNRVRWRERRKAGFPILAKAFGRTSATARP
jgi:hypothetical protein